MIDDEPHIDQARNKRQRSAEPARETSSTSRNGKEDLNKPPSFS